MPMSPEHLYQDATAQLEAFRQGQGGNPSLGSFADDSGANAASWAGFGITAGGVAGLAALPTLAGGYEYLSPVTKAIYNPFVGTMGAFRAGIGQGSIDAARAGVLQKANLTEAAVKDLNIFRRTGLRARSMGSAVRTAGALRTGLGLASGLGATALGLAAPTIAIESLRWGGRQAVEGAKEQAATRSLMQELMPGIGQNSSNIFAPQFATQGFSAGTSSINAARDMIGYQAQAMGTGTAATRNLFSTLGNLGELDTSSAHSMSKSFQESVKHLNEVAKMINSDLETATRVYQNMKQMGLTTKKDQIQALSRFNSISNMTGLNLSEVSDAFMTGATAATQMGLSAKAGGNLMLENAATTALMDHRGDINERYLQAMGGVKGITQRMTEIQLGMGETAYGQAMLAARYNPDGSRRSGGLEYDSHGNLKTDSKFWGEVDPYEMVRMQADTHESLNNSVLGQIARIRSGAKNATQANRRQYEWMANNLGITDPLEQQHYVQNLENQGATRMYEAASGLASETKYEVIQGQWGRLVEDIKAGFSSIGTAAKNAIKPIGEGFRALGRNVSESVRAWARDWGNITSTGIDMKNTLPEFETRILPRMQEDMRTGEASSMWDTSSRGALLESMDKYTHEGILDILEGGIGSTYDSQKSSWFFGNELNENARAYTTLSRGGSLTPEEVDAQRQAFNLRGELTTADGVISARDAIERANEAFYASGAIDYNADKDRQRVLRDLEVRQHHANRGRSGPSKGALLAAGLTGAVIGAVGVGFFTGGTGAWAGASAGFKLGTGALMVGAAYQGNKLGVNLVSRGFARGDQEIDRSTWQAAMQEAMDRGDLEEVRRLGEIAETEGINIDLSSGNAVQNFLDEAHDHQLRMYQAEAGAFNRGVKKGDREGLEFDPQAGDAIDRYHDIRALNLALGRTRSEDLEGDVASIVGSGNVKASARALAALRSRGADTEFSRELERQVAASDMSQDIYDEVRWMQEEGATGDHLLAATEGVGILGEDTITGMGWWEREEFAGRISGLLDDEVDLRSYSLQSTMKKYAGIDPKQYRENQEEYNRGVQEAASKGSTRSERMSLGLEYIQNLRTVTTDAGHYQTLQDAADEAGAHLVRGEITSRALSRYRSNVLREDSDYWGTNLHHVARNLQTKLTSEEEAIQEKLRRGDTLTSEEEETLGRAIQRLNRLVDAGADMSKNQVLKDFEARGGRKAFGSGKEDAGEIMSGLTAGMINDDGTISTQGREMANIDAGLSQYLTLVEMAQSDKKNANRLGEWMVDSGMFADDVSEDIKKRIKEGTFHDAIKDPTGALFGASGESALDLLRSAGRGVMLGLGGQRGKDQEREKYNQDMGKNVSEIKDALEKIGTGTSVVKVHVASAEKGLDMRKGMGGYPEKEKSNEESK